mgnify:CR=1 FL=1
MSLSSDINEDILIADSNKSESDYKVETEFHQSPTTDPVFHDSITAQNDASKDSHITDGISNNTIEERNPEDLENIVTPINIEKFDGLPLEPIEKLPPQTDDALSAKKLLF